MTEEQESNQDAPPVDDTGVPPEVAKSLDEVTDAAAELAGATVQPLAFGPLSGPRSDGGADRNLDLLLDVSIPISVEVGRSQMSLDDILGLVSGSVVPLDKKAEEPVDLRVNGKLVAQGEVVLIDDNYGLRITEIVDAGGRLESLR